VTQSRRLKQVHALMRTSPKGGPFVGTCMKCGTENIPLSAARQECQNPINLTADETLILAIGGGRQ
jgi:hypothetical protein